MEQNTPPNKIIRVRHTPTPKMSERKKSLFGVTTAAMSENMPTVDEDSDLGPMSPLQFSCSPTSNDSDRNRSVRLMNNKYDHNLITFKNVMRQLSPLKCNQQHSVGISPRKGSPRSYYVHGLTNNSDDESENQEHLSPYKSTSPQKSAPFRQNKPGIALKASEIVKHLGSNEKTPSEPNMIEMPRISFRKSLIFDTGHTPDDTHLSPSTRHLLPKRNTLTSATPTTKDSSTIKAKASLSFSESSISAKTFYGSSFSAETPPIRRWTPPSIEIKRIPLKNRRSGGGSTVTRRKITSKSHSKERIPILGNINRGVRHSITKPKVLSAKKQMMALKSMTKARIMKAAIELYGKKIEKNLTSRSPGDSTQITSEQMARLKKVLENRTSLKDQLEIVSRPLNWKGTITTEEEETKNNRDEEDAVEEPPTKIRKFFKSKTSIASNYKVINGFSASVKRGGGGITLQSPKRRKLKAKSSDYDEYLEIERAVSDIIAQLDESTGAVAGADTSASSTATDISFNPVIEPAIDQQVVDASTANIFASQTTEYERLRSLLPYNTTDSAVKDQQENLLDLLYYNNICTQENFNIFIAEPDLHKDEANRVLDQLIQIDENTTATSLVVKSEIDGDGTGITISDDVPMELASQISTMTLGMEVDTTAGQTSKESVSTLNTSNAGPSTSKLYPIFYWDEHTKQATNESQSDKALIDSNSSKLIKWKSIGDKQYQIDAGQKAYGGKLCGECNMYYSMHEPEDEALHRNYHDARAQLHFKGWRDERTVSEIPEWGPKGRIICAKEHDSRAKQERVHLILSVVDKDLGLVEMPLKRHTIVYLAIVKQEVIGVCVAEILKKAHPIIFERGLECMETKKTLAVKCGISRLWVVQKYRRQGIATRLLDAVRTHFIPGYKMYPDDLAFSSPTDMGLSFSRRFFGDHPIQIYDETCF